MFSYLHENLAEGWSSKGGFISHQTHTLQGNPENVDDIIDCKAGALLLQARSQSQKDQVACFSIAQLKFSRHCAIGMTDMMLNFGRIDKCGQCGRTELIESRMRPHNY